MTVFHHGFLILGALALSAFIDCSCGADELDCLEHEPGGLPASELVYRHFQETANSALQRRDAVYEQLKTVQDIRAYQQRLRRLFVRQLGGFPDRTPLHPRIVGSLQAAGYRIEKVLFESQPNHHVPAVLYLPDGEGPYPGVVVSSGHSRTAKAADYNQRYGIALAQHGMAALCYDPIGQGERSQILGSDGNPRFNSTTREHLLIGVGSILVGANTARYRVWDGMRAIDYLCSRADINAEKIGFTGCSGGGTITSYVMALDDRVVCAAPSCYLTTFRRLIDTIGPQDAEQNLFGQLAHGMDHPDYLIMRAPRPTLISATTDDFFDVSGTWESFRQATRIYTRLGRSDQVDLVEADGGHGVRPQNLVATVRWMRRWLLNKDDAVELSEMNLLSEETLQCTEAGQVLLLPQEASVFDLNAEIGRRLAAQRKADRRVGTVQTLRATIREVSGVPPLGTIKKPASDKKGRVTREGYHIDKLVLTTAAGLPIPVLVFHPDEPLEEAYLYLHGSGKRIDTQPGGPIQELVKKGYVVVAADLMGFGETAADQQDELLGDWKTYYMAYLVGRSLVGLRAEGVLICGRWVAEYETDDRRAVHVVAVGAAGVPVLHAAALEPSLFESVTVRDSPASWHEVLPERIPSGMLTNTVHGALQHYDLPDLVQLIGVPKLTLESAE